MKKQLQLSLVSTAVLLAVSTASFAAHSANYKGENFKGEPAAPCPTPLMIKDGFYLGGQVGYDSYRIRANPSYSVDDDVSISSNPALNATGFVGGVYAGYGQYFNDIYYLGAEVFLNGSGASTNMTTTATDATDDSVSSYTKVSVGTSYGISLLPGVKLNDAALLYVRLGYNEARIKGQQTVTVTEVGVGTGSFGMTRTNWRGGFNYGLGMEVAFYQNWSVRGEYTHTNYGSFNSNSTVNGISTSYSSSDNQAMLGLSYHFA